MRTRRLGAALAAGAALALTGCGSGTPPAEDVPALAAALDEVDDAVAAEDHDAAREAVGELVEVARRARRDGELDETETARILRAADALLAALPDVGDEEPADPDPTSPTTSAPPTESASPDESEDEDEAGEGDDPDPDPDPDPGGKPEKEKDDKGNEGKGKGKRD